MDRGRSSCANRSLVRRASIGPAARATTLAWSGSPSMKSLVFYGRWSRTPTPWRQPNPPPIHAQLRRVCGLFLTMYSYLSRVPEWNQASRLDFGSRGTGGKTWLQLHCFQEESSAAGRWARSVHAAQGTAANSRADNKQHGFLGWLHLWSVLFVSFVSPSCSSWFSSANHSTAPLHRPPSSRKALPRVAQAPQFWKAQTWVAQASLPV